MSIKKSHKKLSFPLINVNIQTQQTFVLMKTSSVFVFRRRLHQDEYICLTHDEYIRLTHTSSEDVFKTS